LPIVALQEVMALFGADSAAELHKSRHERVYHAREASQGDRLGDGFVKTKTACTQMKSCSGRLYWRAEGMHVAP
jgi:hypothetical protein